MTCGTYVLYRDVRTKGSGIPFRKAIRWYHSGLEIPLEELGQVVICPGRIVATIRAELEPEWGGASAELMIKYLCETCGAMCFPELPLQAEDLSTFVTEAIAKV